MCAAPELQLAGGQHALGERGVDALGRELLDVDLDVLVERVRNDPPRPFMSGDVRGDLQEPIARRSPALREHAGLVLDGADPVDDLVSEIIGALEGLPEVASDSRE